MAVVPAVRISRRMLFVLVGVILTVIFISIRAIPDKPDLPPREAFIKALAETSGTPGYRYNIEMKLVNNGKDDIISSIKGERAAPEQIHIWGEINNSNLDLYQIKNTFYKKDELSDEWVRYENSEINLAELFMVEINPFYNLGYKELEDVRFNQSDKIDGKKYWHYSAKPVMDDSMLTMLYRDFVYDLWVEPGNYRIRKAEVRAVSKNNAGYKLIITIDFKDFDKNIEIVPPVK